MNVPVDKDLEGKRLEQPGHADRSTGSSVWSSTVARRRSRNRSSATGPLQRVQTETLEVHFRQAIDFSAENVQRRTNRPRFSSSSARGGVRMDARTFEGQKQMSQEAIEVVDLKINLDNGALTAAGPGWVNSVQMRLAADPLRFARHRKQSARLRRRANRRGRVEVSARTFSRLDRRQRATSPSQHDLPRPGPKRPMRRSIGSMRCSRRTIPTNSVPRAW